ncbi:MAG: hypothetical protein WBD40_15925 [Tepidisphaeraceae bacterium]
MNPRHHLAACLIALLSLVPSHGFASSPKSAADPFFPIMAWNHAPADPAVLKRMAECGLTVAGFAYAKDLDAIHAAGMRAIVSDPRVGGYDWQNVDAAKARENVASLVKEVNDHPAVFGYYLRDEPPATYFAGLEKVASVVREMAPGKWPYINLFPNYAEPWQLATTNYQEYLDKFVETCKPPILSYDHYALPSGGGVGANYFRNLEEMRAAARKANVPFWNIVLATAHFDFREVTHADLRFQAYTTLAYGGRGISYFTYFAPAVGNYRMAPIDQFGNPTPTWYSLQNVNHQILKLAPTLLKLKSDGVYHFDPLPAGTTGPSDGTLLTGANGADFLAGDFTHEADGSRWVMVVNRSVTQARPCAPQYRTASKRVQLLSAYTGQLTPFEGEQVWLAPGQGCLLKLD